MSLWKYYFFSWFIYNSTHFISILSQISILGYYNTHFSPQNYMFLSCHAVQIFQDLITKSWVPSYSTQIFVRQGVFLYIYIYIIAFHTLHALELGIVIHNNYNCLFSIIFGPWFVLYFHSSQSQLTAAYLFSIFF